MNLTLWGYNTQFLYVTYAEKQTGKGNKRSLSYLQFNSNKLFLNSMEKGNEVTFIIEMKI
jgi:hypothetical protein